MEIDDQGLLSDKLTKFMLLKTLTSRKALKLAYNLLEILSLLGAPSILHDKCKGFTNSDMTSLKVYCSTMKIITYKASILAKELIEILKIYYVLDATFKKK